jgi:hypothetical protein
MIKRIAFLSFLIFTPFVAYAANCDGGGNCYVRAGSSGNGNGSSWTNACTSFTGACSLSASSARSGTFWVAAGTYGGINISASTSGATLITIKGATPSSHGSATDWSNGFSGQALLPESTISTSYVTINGQTRGTDWRSGYTIKFWNQTNGSGAAIHQCGDNLTYDYLEVQGTTNQVGAPPLGDDNGFLSACQSNNMYVGHSYVHETGNTQFQINYGNSTGGMFEYNYIYKNHTGWNADHDEAFSVTYTNLIIRHNVFQDIMSSGFICDAAGGIPSVGNWEIYGNLFFWDAAYAANPGVFIGDGIVGLFGQNWSGHLYFYNNTISGITQTNTCNSSALYFAPPGSVVVNNVWMNTTNCNPTDSPGGSLTMDYNSYYQNSSNSNDNSAHKKTYSTNPFVNSAAFNFQLTAASAAGTSLAAPYNVDMNGNVRGADGVWDRGAHEFSSGASSLPPAPQNVIVTSIQ